MSANLQSAINLVIGKHTSITPMTADFPYRFQEDIMSITSLWQVAQEQLVPMKGYLACLSPTKTANIQNSPLKKQVGYISGPTGPIKIILWGKHADTLTATSTYFSNKIRVKVSQGQHYLNTPSQENECTTSSAEPFKEKLPTSHWWSLHD